MKSAASPKDPLKRLGMKLLVTSIARRNLRKFQREKRREERSEKYRVLLERIADAFAKCEIDGTFRLPISADEVQLLLKCRGREVLRKGHLHFSSEAGFGRPTSWFVYEHEIGSDSDDDDSDDDDDDDDSESGEEDEDKEEEEEDTAEEVKQAELAEAAVTETNAQSAEDADAEPVDVESDDDGEDGEFVLPSPLLPPAEINGEPVSY